MRRHVTRSLLPLMLALLVTALSVMYPPGDAGAAPAGCTVTGQAYGAQATGAPLANIGPVGQVLLPPGGANTVASVSAGAVGAALTTGTVVNSTADTSSATLAVATSSSTVNNVNALTGLAGAGAAIAATTIRSVASSNSTGVTASSSPAGTTFQNLMISGVAQGNVAANTRVTLPGIGYVIINEQLPTGNGTTTSGLTVNGLHIFVTTAALGLPVGAEIIVASATSGATCAAPTPPPGGAPAPPPGGAPTPPPASAPTPADGEIAGVVTDAATGKPLPGATVLIMDVNGTIIRRLQADANGAFSAADLPPDCYSVSGSHPGYQTVTRGRDCVDEGRRTESNLALPPVAASVPAAPAAASPTATAPVQPLPSAPPAPVSQGVIAGRVTDAATRAPLPGAQVGIVNAGGVTIGTARADGNGGYTVGGLPPGCYTVTGTQPGYAPNQAPNVCVGTTGPAKADVALQPAPVVPASLPSTGSGGSSKSSPFPLVVAVLGIVALAAINRRQRRA